MDHHNGDYSLRAVCEFCQCVGCKTGLTVYRPFPRRLESLTVCRFLYKGSTIPGDPGAVSWVGRKGATKVFNHGRKSPRLGNRLSPAHLQAFKRMLVSTKNDSCYYSSFSEKSAFLEVNSNWKQNILEISTFCAFKRKMFECIWFTDRKTNNKLQARKRAN